MILKDFQIQELIKIGSVEIDPFDEEAQLQPSSIDLRTSDKFYRYPPDLEPELQILDPKNPYLNILERDFISQKGVLIQPKQFFIIETLEYIKVPENISIYLQPKFRLTKMGVGLINAGWLEHGFEGNITLCLYNMNDFPVRIFSSMPVVHIFLDKSS